MCGCFFLCSRAYRVRGRVHSLQSKCYTRHHNGDGWRRSRAWRQVQEFVCSHRPRRSFLQEHPEHRHATGSLWLLGPPRAPSLRQPRSPTRPPRAGRKYCFASPVAISANRNYVVSYFSPSGYVSLDGSFFASDHVSGILTSPSSVFAAGNASSGSNSHVHISESGLQCE